MSQFRALHIENQSIDNIAIDIFAHTNITPEDELISQEEISEINLAINSLPNKCKIAFKLVKENHLKYKEAAEILNISVKTLEAHLTTAMKKIREKLKDSI
nr:sigma-70 family RNA polymerase sigma factor [Bacteroides clarus]